MYEFHGWVNVWAFGPDEGTFAKKEAATIVIRARLAEARDEIRGWFEVRETFNGQVVVVAHGLRNHKQQGPLELFRWLGEQYPLSYGLLYIHDDEHPLQNNEFVVYRLAHGALTEFSDSLLSPCIPTVEPPGA